ncbi:GTP pyrophosphokinase [Stomatobaculum longum]|jgi:relA/spoT domain protein|uniref:GTP pyrophosphokinase n=1 Tax=Stomatobaculum longum TaxID=796942 RepID=UPI0028E75910|nr:GTP pyrophosphokinase family protein [Stomatobaculum longum]
MAESGIYGNFTETLFAVKKKLELQILAWNEEAAQRGEHKCFEHLTSRVKTERSMRDKLLRRGLEETTENALCRLTDAIGLRIVTRFVDDIYRVKAKLAALPGVEIAEEKDYIQNVKPSGYRSLHLILHCETDAPDFYGRVPGQFFVEVQIRTIAMDSWASLEHEMHYKREGGNRALIAAELKHVADDLASCDLSMQTIRNMIRKEEA